MWHRIGKTLSLFKDKTFFPYFYQVSPTGIFKTIDNKKVNKVLCSRPSDVKNRRDEGSYEADILFTKRYIIDKIVSFGKSDLKYSFIDIEVLTKELPNYLYPEQPISCISCSNSYTEEIKTFYLKDYLDPRIAVKDWSELEKKLLDAFVKWIKEQQFDLLCLDENTKIKTHKGFKILKDIELEEEVLSINRHNDFTKAKIIRISKKQEEGLEIQTRTNTIKSSKNHPFLITNLNNLVYKHDNFKTIKQAKELTKKDFILTPINYLPYYGQEDEYFWFVGYYLGDGTKGKQNRLEVRDDNEEMMGIVKKILNRNGIAMYLHKYNNCYHLYSKNSLKANDWKKSIDILYKNLSIYLYGLNTNQQTNIISGLIDADGTYTGNSLSFSNTNEVLIDWMSWVLWGIGIPNKKDNGYSGKKSKQKCYTLRIYSSSKNYRLFLKHPKKKLFLKHTVNHIDTIPIKNLLLKLIEEWNVKLSYKDKMKLFCSNQTITREFVHYIIDIIKTNKLSKYQITKLDELNKYINTYFFNSIKQIKNIKNLKLIDITLDKHHLFIANNLLTHNCGWNFIEFDWRYLCARYKKLFGCELAEMLSPIAQARYLGGKQEVEPNLIPAGISVMDYLEMYKKIYRTESSYALDAVCQKELKEQSYKKVDFSRLADEIKEKNINDVRRMIDLDKKLEIVEYYDELRRMSMCEWSDVCWNSKMIDMILLREAKQKGIILPSKHYGQEISDEIEFEGAYRRADLGFFKNNIWKMDISGTYPSIINNLCLDVSNLTEDKHSQKIDITDRETNTFKYSIYMTQNQNTLLPIIARKLLNKKDTIKKELEQANPESEEGKDLQIKYDAIKAVVNSLFGVCGLKIFRLYNVHIASAITSIARDLLHYTEDKIKEKGINVIYLDTDGIMIESKENPTELFNQLIQQWAKERYNRERIDIKFECEGRFEKILIVAMCHYKGYLRKLNGKLKEEIKGIEAKRKDSSKFIKEFQTILIEKIMNEEPQEEIVKWINSEKEKIKTLPLQDIGFPARLTKQDGEYKTIVTNAKGTTFIRKLPIHIQAKNNSKKIFGKFDKQLGDNYWWIYYVD